MKYVYMHNGPGGCNGKAFYYDEKPEAPLKSAHAILLSGKKPRPGELIICGTCGTMMVLHKKNFVENPEAEPCTSK